MKTNPLDHIKIASPCSADWDEMRGDNRKRFCSHCKLNVYNLSEMTRTEAENLLFEMEGKMCVRLYKRNDGTVITQDCPIGWQAIKQKVSRFATAVLGLIAGFFGGVFAVSQTSFDISKLSEEIEFEKTNTVKAINGVPIEKQLKSELPKGAIDFSGGISNGPELMDMMWIFTERYPKDSK